MAVHGCDERSLRECATDRFHTENSQTAIVDADAIVPMLKIIESKNDAVKRSVASVLSKMAVHGAACVIVLPVNFTRRELTGGHG